MRLQTKHVVLGVVGWLLTAFCAFGQTASGTISGQVFTMQGRPAAFAPVRVCANTSTGTPCTPTSNIYSDAALTQQLPNPTTADQYGNYSIFVAVGVYVVQISPAPGTTYSYLVSVASGSGGGGSGNVLAAPQFRIYIQPNAGTNAIAGPAPTNGNAVAPLMQGFYNTDLFTTGSGNNGLGNLEAGACSVGGCTPMFSANSTSTESFIPIVANTHVQDYRGGSQADAFYNPSAAGAGGYTQNGARPQVGHALVMNYDQSQINSGSQNQLLINENITGNAPGWTWGSNTGETGFGDWSTVKGHNYVMNVSTPAIAQYAGGVLTKTSTGDSASLYLYTRPDAGNTSPADEGAEGVEAQVLQNSTWMQGLVGTGATTGTQALPTTFQSGTNSRSQFAVGGYMLDISKVILSNAHVTGAATQMANNGPWVFSIDTAVTESTAWGYANANVPTPANPTQPQTDTVAFTVVGGTNVAGYTTGKAWLDGAEQIEQVNITAVGTISGGIQSVTFTHMYPNSMQDSATSTRTFLFQGGTNGFYSPIAISNGTTYGGFLLGYPIFGATDTSHLAGRFSAGGTNNATPSFFSTTTTNVPLLNLSVSGTTVTATCNCGATAYVFNGLGSVVIANASNSAYNGTGTNVKTINNNQLQWTQTGPTGTSASATISYAPLTYSFNLYPGAIVVQPSATATPTIANLGPNDVAWAFNDHIQNVQQPSFRGNLFGGVMQVFSPDSQFQNGIALLGFGVSGGGISGQYNYLSVNNGNSTGIYQGGGGLLAPPTGITFKGVIGKVLNVLTAPLDHSAVFNIGCAIDGCNSTNNTNILYINNATGQMSYIPLTNQFFFSNLTTPNMQGSILSTGDSRWINGGITGGAAVALTAASSGPGNRYSSLGSYGMFGSGFQMDTSADVAAHAFYAGTLYAGALAPTGVGANPSGTLGSSTYSYVAVSNTQNGTSVQSNTITTNQGNATLSATNLIAVQFTPGKGAQSIDVYRTAAPAGYSLGRICTAVDNWSAGGNGDAPCKDTGQATTGSLPSNVDTSGLLQATTATIGNLTVTGTCTGCGGGGGGTVTSVGLTTPSWLTVGGSPITSSGVLAITPTSGQTANQFLATPNGATGALGLRSLVAADMPFAAILSQANVFTSVAGNEFTNQVKLDDGSISYAGYESHTVTPSTTGTNYNSPPYDALGWFWTGTLNQSDWWSWSDIVGTGTSPTSTLQFIHTGSAGLSSVQFPAVQITGALLNINTIAYNWPSSQASGPLCDDGTGNLTWGTCGGSGSPFITSLTTTGSSGNATVNSGILNIPNYTYTLPNATTSVLGGVKPDGTTCTTTAGVLTCPGSGGISGLTTGFIPIATSPTAIGNSLLDYGVTTASTFTFGAPVAFNDGSGQGGGFNGTEGTAITGSSAHDALWADSTDHRLKMNNNNGGATDVVGFSDQASSSLFGVVKVDGTTITATGGVISAVGGGGVTNSTATIGTTAIAANTCTSASTITMTGITTSMTINFTPSTDISTVTGWGSTGGLSIDAWPTANTTNYRVCNATASSITPSSSVTFNVSAR